jgi:hypothetical protein
MFPKEFLIDHPLITFIIPSTKKKVRFRPFLCKEEKILLSAKDTPEDMINAIKQIITNCAVDNDVNVNTLALFDIEYIYLKLVSISVNNIRHVRYRDIEDQKIYEFDIDLNTVEVTYNPTHSNKIKINDSTGLILKYPTGNLPKNLWNMTNATDALFTIFKTCLHQVYKGEHVLNFSEQTPEDIDEFVDKLPINVFDQFKIYVKTMPKISHTLEYTNTKGNKHQIKLESLEDFFS